ncbi:MAG TPA: DUF2569 domain-containing protein [Gammaproteobacteria bacterium]|nr:DUF2569 domain-containing protein [Gammaproteobacteria bacterium]
MYAAYLFFSKKKFFPRLYIGLLLFTLAFILVDAAAVTAVFPKILMFGPDTVQQFLRSLVAAGIWIPYVRRSKRVKATFVR